MKNKKLVINIFACLISFVATLGINFFLTPYITNNVGIEAYGFVSLANNFVNYASIVTLALNSMASRFVSISVFKKDYENASKYFTSVLVANIFMIIFLMIPSILCVIYLDSIIAIPFNLVWSVKILFLLIFFNFFISLINSTYSISTYAADKIELFTLRNMETSIIKILLMFVLFYIFDANIIFVGIATVISTLYFLIFNVYYKKKFLPFIEVKKIYFDIKKVIEIIISGIWNTITKIGQILTDGLDLLISNLFVSATAMGQLSIVKTISSSISILTSSLVNIFQPSITKKYAKNDKKIVKEINFSMKIVALFSNILLVGILVFGKYFYQLWIPNEDANLLYLLTIISLVGNSINYAVNPLFSVFTVTNKLKVNSLVIVGLGFFNIGVVFLLLKFVPFINPLIIIAGVSAVTSTIKNLIFVPIYSAKCLEVDKKSFYPPIVKSVVSSLFMGAVFSIFTYTFDINSWLKLIIFAIICGALGFGISLLVLFDKEEVKKLISLIKNKIGKKELKSE